MALMWWRWLWHDVAVESCWRWCRYADVTYGAMSLSSHAGDDVAEAILVVAWCRCRILLAIGVAEATLVMAWCRCRVLQAMLLLRRCWLWRDVVVVSCWWWCCRVDVDCSTMSLSSHAVTDATEALLLSGICVPVCWGSLKNCSKRMYNLCPLTKFA
jgi:hypothetical protein